jgi:hypothetical protein
MDDSTSGGMLAFTVIASLVAAAIVVVVGRRWMNGSLTRRFQYVEIQPISIPRPGADAQQSA